MFASHNTPEGIMQATSDKTYNGWTNYATWAVGMFLDGNYTGEGTYSDVLEMVREIDDENGALSHGEITYRVAEALQEYVEQEVFGDEAPATIATDLLRAAVSEVNWRELAESKLSEISES